MACRRTSEEDVNTAPKKLKVVNQGGRKGAESKIGLSEKHAMIEIIISPCGHRKAGRDLNRNYSSTRCSYYYDAVKDAIQLCDPSIEA